jgi:type VI secretion system protein ImpH
MATTVGDEADALAFCRALADAPYRYDFYQTLRRLECLHPTKPRWGEARRPVDEPLRLGQDPEMTFAPSPLTSFEMGHDGRPPRLGVRLFGLLGPNGPLPLHLTEYARDRLLRAGDPTFARFLDVFHHRFLALFYRAWAQAQPHVNHDRPRHDRFAVYIGSFFAMASPVVRERDTVPDLAKLFHAGTLIRHTRNAEGLASILEHFFRVPVQLQEFVGHWMPLGRRERTQLARDGATLGSGAVLGGRVWDRQHKFRIQLGPLTFAQYEAFLPGGARLQELVDWVRSYLNFEFEWDVRLALTGCAVPRTRLGIGGRLGWTTWLGEWRGNDNAADLYLNAEALVAGRGHA